MTQTDGALTLNDLGIGGGHAIWAFRAAAMNHADCPTLIHGFENIMSAYGRPAVRAIASLTRALGHDGRRKLGIACPGCGYVTADELSVVALLSAAQREDDDLADAHLAWLMGGYGEDDAKRAALQVGALFKAAHVAITPPPIEISAPKRPLPASSFHSAGYA